MEPVHLEQQLELRQQQLQEIAGTFRVSYAVFVVAFQRVAKCCHDIPKQTLSAFVFSQK